MTEPNDHIELDRQDDELGHRLSGQRPVPRASFRGALARRLTATDPGYGPRPERLGAMVAAYAGSGLVLIALGALQATGSL
jgi:hypothetical protein